MKLTRSAMLFGVIGAAALLAGCTPAKIVGKTADGKTIEISFYPGGSSLDDLAIISGVNYFGKAQYQFDDPLGDIGFRLISGERVQAECSETGNNIIGQPECKKYTVYRSTFSLIPTGTVFEKPSTY